MSPDEQLMHEQVIWQAGYDAAKRDLAYEHASIYGAGYRSGLAAGSAAQAQQ